jgi:hypothetical protein
MKVEIAGDIATGHGDYVAHAACTVLDTHCRFGFGQAESPVSLRYHRVAHTACRR